MLQRMCMCRFGHRQPLQGIMFMQGGIIHMIIRHVHAVHPSNYWNSSNATSGGQTCALTGKNTVQFLFPSNSCCFFFSKITTIVNHHNHVFMIPRMIHWPWRGKSHLKPPCFRTWHAKWFVTWKTAGGLKNISSHRLLGDHRPDLNPLILVSQSCNCDSSAVLKCSGFFLIRDAVQAQSPS